MTKTIQYTVELFRLEEEHIVTSPSSIPMDLVNEMFDDCMYSHEEIHAVYLNNAKRIGYTERIATGSMNACVMNLPKMYTTMHIQRMQGVILIHNHPSGFAKFSTADINLAKRVHKGCETLGLELIDFLIALPNGSLLSAKDKGLV